LEKARVWTDLYYEVVEYYFWEPQRIGRRRDPSRKSQPWDYWRGKLQKQETAFNHILNLLFHMAPQELVDRAVSALLGREVEGLELVNAGGLDPNVVQPDMIFTDWKDLIFVEMKVDSRSSVDQFVKYAIAAQYILEGPEDLSSVDLVFLTKTKSHNKVWHRAKADGLDSFDALRRHAVRGLDGDMEVWREAGVPRYMRENPGAVPGLRNRVQSIGLALADYEGLSNVLREYAAENQTVARLVDGVLAELARRGL